MQELASVLEEARAPRYLEASRTLDPKSSMMHCAGAARARTIRARLRHWKRLRMWLMRTKGIPWPQEAAEVIDFLEDMVAGGCARTGPEALLTAVNFMEEKAGWPEHRRVGASAALVSAVKNHSASLSTGAKPTIKAPGLPAAATIALELYVQDAEKPSYTRVYAWTVLLKVWAALRYDDVMGISPAGVELVGNALIVRLDRTKTSGPGRKNRWLMAYVSEDASFSGEDWLRSGFEILKSESFSFERDYLLPLPTADLGELPGGCRHTATALG